MIKEELIQGEVYVLNLNNEKYKNEVMVGMVCGIDYIINNIVDAEQDLLIISFEDGQLHLLNYADIIRAIHVKRRRGE